MAEEKKGAGDAEGTGAAKGPKLIMGMPIPLLALVAANVLIMVGGVGYIYYAKMIYKAPSITEAKVVAEINKKVDKKIANEDPNAIFTEVFPEMTINLRTIPGSANHYASVEVSVECNSTSCHNQIKILKDKILDTVRSNIGSRSFNELNSLETKFRIKHEILKSINGFMKGTAATNIYFTSFVVQ